MVTDLLSLNLCYVNHELKLYVWAHSHAKNTNIQSSTLQYDIILKAFAFPDAALCFAIKIQDHMSLAVNRITVVFSDGGFSSREM